MKVLVIGAGPVGAAIFSLCERAGHDVQIMDLEASRVEPEKFDVLHVCFPHSSYFEFHVINYISKFAPDLTLIESTVPVGTTYEIYEGLSGMYNICHSPVRGLHDNVMEGLKKYKKFVGPCKFEDAGYAIGHYASLGLEVHVASSCFETEFAKLANLSYFAVQIAFFQELDRRAKNFCWDDIKAFFETTGFDRPVREPNFIGGCCVMQGLRMLLDGTDLWAWVNASNQKRKVEE